MTESLILRLAGRHRGARQVQKYIQTLKYNRASTLRSALETARAKTAHCMEGAMLAAAMMEAQGYPPLVLDFESHDGLDHVIFIYRQRGRWGSIGKSRDPGLEGRPPVFRSLRDLAWSYFDPYVDKTGRLTGYRKVHLDETKSDWRASKKNLWKAENYLLSLRHTPMRSSETRYLRLRKRYLKGLRLPVKKIWW